MNDFLYSILIQQGQIVTGAANPWFRGDIGIKDGRIAKIGHIKRKHADQVIDARKLIVCPGFIDVHSHSDFIISILPSADSTLMQGVTTLVTGNCGFSLAPTTPETNVLLRKGLSPFIPPEVHLEMPWRSFSTYLETESALDLAVNIGHLVGHGTIRIEISDGMNVGFWSCDRGLLKSGTWHHVAIIVDGAPDVISFVVDGILCDGGTASNHGWGRFSPELSNVDGSSRVRLASSLVGRLKRLRVYSRYLRTSEAIANYRAGRETVILRDAN